MRVPHEGVIAVRLVIAKNHDDIGLGTMLVNTSRLFGNDLQSERSEKICAEQGSNDYRGCETHEDHKGGSNLVSEDTAYTETLGRA